VPTVAGRCILHLGLNAIFIGYGSRGNILRKEPNGKTVRHGLVAAVKRLERATRHIAGGASPQIVNCHNETLLGAGIECLAGGELHYR